MPDQAHDLRQLATGRGPAGSPQRGDRPTLLVVFGGKGGVGTTTVALSLAAGLSASGKRALFVDADGRGDAAVICGIDGDMLDGQQSRERAACLGPGGFEIVTGQRDWRESHSPAWVACQIIDQVHNGVLSAETVVVDAGNGRGGAATRLCREANAILIVTTSEPASVVGAFAAIKALVGDGQRHTTPPLHLLVNKTRTGREAELVYYRLRRACKRILGIDLRSTGQFAATRPTRQKLLVDKIGLSIQLPVADTIRRVLAAELLSSYTRHGDFNAASSQNRLLLGMEF
jgi:flagellar biosynthesis protein FlhG